MYVYAKMNTNSSNTIDRSDDVDELLDNENGLLLEWLYISMNRTWRNWIKHMYIDDKKNFEKKKNLLKLKILQLYIILSMMNANVV